MSFRGALLGIVAALGVACAAGDSLVPLDGANGAGDAVRAGDGASDGSIDGTTDGAATDGAAADGSAMDGSSMDSALDGGMDAALGDGGLGDGALDDGALGDGTLMLPEGAVLLPDGAVLLPDGAVISLDAGAPSDGSTRACVGADGGSPCGPTEVCSNGLDDNCDGLVDEGCICVPGVDRERCYDGCPTLAGVGVCVWGSQVCPGSGEFGHYDGHCVGAGRPQTVVCGAQRDFLCDGVIDEGCACRPGEMRSCYTGPASTRNVGACADGVQRCGATDGGTGWGPCTGEVLPSAASCDGIDHACNGMPYAGCGCMPGTTRSCYDGPSGTSGVGLCRAGMQACLVTGGVASWGACVGQVLPAANTCDGVDRQCDGMPTAGCACAPGTTRSCYDGPAGTATVGLCHAGTQTCIVSAGRPGWGACIGEVLPSSAACDGLDHLCNGMPNAGCTCTPGTSRRCYDGPSGTEGIGPCHAGSQTCVTGPGGVGTAWGECTGEVVPTSNRCDGVDRQCNGMPSAGCACIAGTTRSCYDGPVGTAGVGPCHAGSQTCLSSGTGWSACAGQILPGPELCDGVDHLCNGVPNTGCACVPGATRHCYTGPTGTSGVGTCHDGTQTCVAGAGGVGSSWGACGGDVVPTASRCDGVDTMCNGMPYAGCVCTPGAVRSCYDGPAGTSGVGVCHGGTQTCAMTASGLAWGACAGAVLPGPELCDGIDHLCNGVPNTGCACTVGTTRGCYDGPTGTDGVGVCRAGTQTCVAGTGGVGSSWGTCTGEVLPGTIACDGIDHACDGAYATDCPCTLGQTRSCYDGAAGTAGVGTCHAGTQSCVANPRGGSMWATTCTGEVVPAAASCDGLDHACTGTLPNCAPTITCPAPVTTLVGTAVTLTGSATAIAPSTISTYAWTVVSAPAGATYTFTTTTANATMFTANNAGVYTVRLTATDSMGRSASCTVLVTATANSYLGTEFWGVTLSNSQLASGTTFQYAIAIGNPNAAAVTVTVTGGAASATTTFSVPGNSTVTQTLPWVAAISHNSSTTSGFSPATSSRVTNGAYRIVTSAPVSAYQFNPLTFTTGGATPTYSYTNDASLLLPTVALTGNYIAMAHNSFYADGGFVTIVGTSATTTTVTVTLSAAITAGTGVTAAAAGTVQTYTLARGDVVQLISTYPLPPVCTPSSGTCTFQTADLTGTVISATQPVAVFGGHDCTNMSWPAGASMACDHLEQQLFPMETWGRDVVVSQLQDRSATERYMVRIMSRENGNTVSFVPSSVHAAVALNRGQFVEFETASDFEVTGTQPILVGQFMEGQDTTAGATVGDPSFVLEVPTPQYRTNYNFVVPSTYTSSFINVVGVVGATMLLDGTALSATPLTIPGTSWAVWRQALPAGSHTITTTGAAGFGLKVLGVASYTSYAYPGGLDLRALP